MQEGGCLCGAVRYAVKAPPQRLTICHCRFCQRATGSAYMAEPIFRKSDLVMLAGQPKVYPHRSEGSGKMVYVQFCGTCGTKLYLSFERFPDSVGVYAGTFDDPNWFPRQQETTKHIFLDVAQVGTVIGAGMKTYRQHAMTNDGAPTEARVFDEPHTIGETHSNPK